MTYQVTVLPAAQRQLKRLESRIQRRIQGVIDSLAEDPHPPASIRMKGTQEFRVRTGDYRVIYQIFENRLEIEVIRLGDRKDIYR